MACANAGQLVGLLLAQLVSEGAPIILNAAVPDDSDGRVLKEIFRENTDFANRGVRFQKVEEKRVEEVERTKEDEEEVKKRLRELGYI